MRSKLGRYPWLPLLILTLGCAVSTMFVLVSLARGLLVAAKAAITLRRRAEEAGRAGVIPRQEQKLEGA